MSRDHSVECGDRGRAGWDGAPMIKPSKRVREQAAVICSAMACNDELYLQDAEEALGDGPWCDAGELAHNVGLHIVFGRMRRGEYSLVGEHDWAEAEALLRTGEFPP